MTSYSLKAECSHCGRYGTVDDVTLICSNCGERHEITEAEREQRDADMALWRQYSTRQRRSKWRRRDPFA